MAKLDALDPQGLARLAKVIRSEVRALPDSQTEELAALLGAAPPSAGEATS